jgi:hypothetical protein
MSNRYVVARHCFGGIGDHLLCLIGAWWVARRTGRILVVDWRGSRFNPNPPGGNCFYSYFERVTTLGGVEIIADDTVAEIDFPLPMWPNKWTTATLKSPDHIKHTSTEVSDVNKMVNSDADVAQPTVVLNQWIKPLPPRDAMREMLRDLRAVESIRARADDFWGEHIDSRPAVAIHLRHGNGENIGLRAAFWLGPIALAKQLMLDAGNDIHKSGLSGRFSDNAAESLVGSPSQSGAERRFGRRVAAEFRSLSQITVLANAVPFLFCDSAQIIKMMKEILPNLVACPKRLLNRGEGPLHQFDAGAVRHSENGGVRGGTIANEITNEMFVELELMRRCAALIYMDSGFSIVSRIMLDDSRLVPLTPNFVNRFVPKIIRRFI